MESLKGHDGHQGAPTLQAFEREQLRRLTALSFMEAMTLVILCFIAAPLKHIYGWNLGTQILGPLHGLIFGLYMWTVLGTMAWGRWRGLEIARLIVVAFIPFAGFANIRWLRARTESLTSATAT
jgi:integral membrane protein